MAQYTPSSGDYMRPYRSPWGAFPTRQFSPASTGATVLQGTLMTLSTGASVGTSNPQSIVIPSTATPGGLNYFQLVGVLAEKSSAYASSAVLPAPVMVWEANPMVEFKATTIGGAQTSSIIGQRRDIQWDSTLTIHRINLGTSTTTDWRVVITQNLGAEGDSGGYVAFRFLSKLSENIGSSAAITSTTPVLAFYC